MLKRLSLFSTLIRRAMSSQSTSTTQALIRAQPVRGKNFKIALIQLGGTNSDKLHNINLAREKIREAAKGDKNGKPEMIVLPVSLQPACRLTFFDM
jgi:hypothetical protein